MDKPIIFISHSAKEEISSNLLDKIYGGLTDAGYEVFVDKVRIKPGDIWRDEIYTWLALCHAAIVLLSKDAICSHWVEKEAIILDWRRHLRKDFVILPVLLNGVTRDEINNISHLKHLPATQMISGEIENKPREPDEIFHDILNQLEIVKEKLKTEVPLYKFEQHIKTILYGINNKEFPLYVANELEIDLELEKFPGLDPAIPLSRKLFHLELRKITKMIQYVSIHLNSESCSNIVKILTIFSINPLSAVKILEIAQNSKTGCINTIRDQTGKMYIRRAYCKILGPKIGSVLNKYGENHETEIMIDVDLALKKAIGLNDPNTNLNDRLIRMEKDAIPVFILVNGIFPENVIEKLKSKYPSVIFLFLTGELPENDLHNINIILPRLEKEEEEDIHYQVDMMNSYINESKEKN